MECYDDAKQNNQFTGHQATQLYHNRNDTQAPIYIKNKNQQQHTNSGLSIKQNQQEHTIANKPQMQSQSSTSALSLSGSSVIDIFLNLSLR